MHNRTFVLLLGVVLLSPQAAAAASAYACAGAALAGGAQLLCSHINPKAPSQNCTYSWALMSSDNRTVVVQGTFLLPPESTNMVVYQGFGFDAPLANPIITCVGAPG